MGFPAAVPRLLPNLLFLLAHLHRLSSWLRPPKQLGLRRPPPPPGAENCPAVRFDELSISNAGTSAGTPILPEGCVVCLSDFHGAARVRRPRGCQHVFHFGCLDRWVAHGHRTCPLCRAPFLLIVPPPAGVMIPTGTCLHNLATVLLDDKL
ncbi:hypothetical protein VPH35_134088 [Triticum aestivum]